MQRSASAHGGHTTNAGPAGSNMNDAGYPFRGSYKMDKKLNHGHGGVGKDTPTSMLMHVSGSNLVISQVTVPKNASLACELGVGNERPKLVTFPFADRSLQVPADGKEYNLTAIVTSGPQKHYCKMLLQDLGGPSRLLEIRSGFPETTPPVHFLCDAAKVIADPKTGIFRIPTDARDCQLVVPPQFVRNVVSGGGILEIKAAPSRTIPPVHFICDAARILPDPITGSYRLPTDAMECQLVVPESPQLPRFITVETVPNAHNPTACTMVAANGSEFLLTPYTATVLPLSETGNLTLRLPIPQAATSTTTARAALPEVYTDIAQVPVMSTDGASLGATVETRFSAAAHGCIVTLNVSGYPEISGNGAASINVNGALSHKVHMLLTDPTTGEKLLSQSSTIPASASVSVPVILKIGEEVEGASGPHPIRKALLSSEKGAVVIADGRPPNADGSIPVALDTAVSHVVEVSNRSTGASARVQLDARSSTFEEPKWVWDLVKVIDDGKNKPDEALQNALKAVNPQTPNGAKILDFILNHPSLNAIFPRFSFTMRDDGSGVTDLQCEGYGLSFAHGNTPPCHIQAGGGTNFDPHQPLHLFATDKNTGNKRAEIIIRSSVEGDNFLKNIDQTLAAHCRNPNVDPRVGDVLYNEMRRIPTPTPLSRSVMPNLLRICRGLETNDPFLQRLLPNLNECANQPHKLQPQMDKFLRDFMAVQTPTALQQEVLGAIGRAGGDGRSGTKVIIRPTSNISVNATIDGVNPYSISPNGGTIDLPLGCRTLELACSYGGSPPTIAVVEGTGGSTTKVTVSKQSDVNVNASVDGAAPYSLPPTGATITGCRSLDLTCSGVSSAFISKLIEGYNRTAPNMNSLRIEWSNINANTPEEAELLRILCRLLQDMAVAAAPSQPIVQQQVTRQPLITFLVNHLGTGLDNVNLTDAASALQNGGLPLQLWAECDNIPTIFLVTPHSSVPPTNVQQQNQVDGVRPPRSIKLSAKDPATGKTVSEVTAFLSANSGRPDGFGSLETTISGNGDETIVRLAVAHPYKVSCRLADEESRNHYGARVGGLSAFDLVYGASSNHAVHNTSNFLNQNDPTSVVPSQTVTKRLDCSRPHNLIVSIYDFNGKLLTENRLTVPRLGNATMELDYREGILSFKPVSNAVMTAAVDGSTERTVSHAIPLDIDQPHSVKLRQYASDGRGARGGETGVSIPIFISGKDLEDITLIYRTYVKSSPQSIEPALNQLKLHARNKIVRDLIDQLIAACGNGGVGNRGAAFGMVDTTTTDTKQTASGGGSEKAIFFRLRGEEERRRT